jgi:hypothetical protein
MGVTNMKQKILNMNFKTFFLAIIFSTGLILIQSCGIDDSPMQPKGDYISGYAYFVDNNYLNQGGYYAVALYDNNPAPFSYNPVKIENIDMSTLNPHYYRLNWDGTGSYYAAVVWVRGNGTSVPIVLGTYGCDTTHGCSDNKIIAFPNFTGADYNIRCWNDTTQRLY